MKHKPARSTDTSPGSRKNLDELEAEVQTSTIERHQDVVAGVEQQKWLRKSEQGDKWNRCLIEGMIVLSETGARDEQTTPP